MGLFDDLIPKPTPDKPQGMFDDLVAQGKKQKELAAKTDVTGGMFADLIPRKQDAQVTPNTRQPAAIPEKPGAVKEYWDATKAAYTDITGEFKKGFGDKNPIDLFKTESLPAHLVQGMKRPANVALDVDEQGGLIGTDTAPPEPKKSNDGPKPGMIDDLKALGVSTTEHPGLVIGSLVKSVVADPELLLPWLWEAIPEATAARVAQAARAMGASVDIAKAAEVGGRVAGRMGVGGAVSGTVEAGDQFSKGELDVGKIGTSAAEGAAMSIPGRMGGKKVAEARVAEGVATPHEQAVAAGVAEPVQADMFNPAEAREAAKIPDAALTTMDTTREALAQATEHDPVTPEMIAEVGKEKIRPPNESRDRLVKAVKQAALGGAIGAGVGYAVSNPDKGEHGAEAGLIIGAALPLLKARKYLGPDISEIINARNGQVKSVARHVYQFQNQIEKAVPLKADREAISEMIDRGVEPAKDSPHYDAYRNLKDYFAQMGQLAKDAGVVDGLRDNYISHIVEEDNSAKVGILQKLFGGGESGGGGKGGKSFGMERKYDTFEELQNALKDSGLKLKTKDASEIAGIYGNAVYKSIADKRLIGALKETKLPDGSGLMVPVADAPRTYIRMESPVLAGVAVHPDIAPDLKFVFNAHNPNWIMRKLSQLTSITKRIAVSTSMFHAKSLIDGMIPASVGLGDTVNPFGATKRALKMYREGGNNDTIDKLIKGGLQVGTPEDVAGHEVQHGLDHFAEVINSRLPLKLTGLGYAAKGLAKIDKGIEHLTFGFLQTGFKLNVASSEFERLVGRGLEPARAAKLAASYANDIFGSLDYYRVATDTDSHIMRKLGTAALNQNARRVLQLVMFAPDWTMATFRSMAKALPGGATDAEAMQMHRRYLVKSAIYYMTFANALNYALSGHSVFSNKNPTRVELGDGRTMQFSKHDTEPLEWLRDPVTTLTNKEAFLPSTVNKLYRAHTDAALRHKPEPTPFDDAESVASGAMPISLQQFVQNGMSLEDLSGMLGAPIYGKAKDVKKDRAATAKEKKIQESY